MYQYVRSMRGREYENWIEDRSVATQVRVFDSAEIDALICDPRTWLPLVFYSLWALVQIPLFGGFVLIEQILVASIAAMALTLGDIASLSSPLFKLPCHMHFLLFGLPKKFRHTDWKTNVFLALVITLLCSFFGYPIATLVVIGLQVYKQKK